LANQSGVIFHCLVRNFKNEYANALFVENIEHLHLLSKEVASFPEAKDFFSLIEMGTVKMEFHEILKDDFKIPMGFACIEHGTFTLKEAATVDSFIEASNKLEKNYLSTFDNNLEHFVGGIKGKKVSEVAIGKAYAKTKQVCYGYFENQYGQALLNLADMETVELDFWYLIA
jgi:uncharacterized protein YifE (UPF0438 family)